MAKITWNGKEARLQRPCSQQGRRFIFRLAAFAKKFLGRGENNRPRHRSDEFGDDENIFSKVEDKNTV